MSEFFPQQRWTSEGEPELGVGFIAEVGFGRVQVQFPASGETRIYAEDSAPLRRVQFKPGDTIVDQEQQPLVVEYVEEGGDLLLYKSGDRILSEADLGQVSDKHGVDDQLLMGEVANPDVFALRRRTLELDHRRRVSSTIGFVGGRIDLIPHQLYIAHEVSSRFAPRVLLSDQVGLGKTIEACLILHRLLLSGRIKRALIVVPESLLHQWFVEMLRRFNLWFHIFDEERCEAIEENAPDGNPFLDDQLVICSASFLASSPKRAQQAISGEWDMLVVDEAHHLKWSPEKASPEYTVVEFLSQQTPGLLLLTATPEQLGVESHFARLRLLDPDRYSDLESFKNESQDHSAVAEVAQKLVDKTELAAQDLALLTDVTEADKLEAVKAGDDHARQALIEDLLDQHGPGRVVFRNTRAAMQGFPKRVAHMVEVRTDNPVIWEERLTKEYEADLLKGAKDFWFDEDPRVQWLVNKLDQLNPQKVLLICRTKQKVLALESALLALSPAKVGVFHEDLTLVQRDRNAAWFAEEDGARIMLCSEIGSEGRNFQFAHHLVLFDLPENPELLEQRIGRLDRIGQVEDIQVHVPYLAGSPQGVLVRWYQEGLNAFEENLEGGNQLSAAFGGRLQEVIKADQNKGLQELITETANYRNDLKSTLAEGRDRLLEMNSFRPSVAQGLVEQINDQDGDVALEHYMMRVFEHFGIEIEDLAPRSYMVRPARTNQESFPSIPDEGVAITFDRTRALSREDLSFISWDHPMASGALDMVLSLGAGASSFGVLRGEDDQGMILEAMFVLETAGEQSLHIDRFLPNTPIRVVIDHTGEEVSDVYPEHRINDSVKPGQIDDLIENETIADVLIPHMIKTANEVAEVMREKVIEKGMTKMGQTLDHELNRLMALHKKNSHIRPEEVQIALKEKAMLEGMIADARVRLDSLMLVRLA